MAGKRHSEQILGLTFVPVGRRSIHESDNGRHGGSLWAKPKFDVDPLRRLAIKHKARPTHHLKATVRHFEKQQ
jgi:hypothetical protein